MKKTLLALMVIFLGTQAFSQEEEEYEYVYEDEAPAEPAVRPPARPAVRPVAKPVDPNARILGVSANLRTITGELNNWQVVYFLSPAIRTSASIAFNSGTTKLTTVPSPVPIATESTVSEWSLGVTGAMQFSTPLPSYAGLALNYGSRSLKTASTISFSRMGAGLLAGTEFKFNPSLGLSVETRLMYNMRQEEPPSAQYQEHEVVLLNSTTNVWLTWYFL